MPSKFYIRSFHPETYHHIFNRGAYKHNIFKDDSDYSTFLNIISFYLQNPLGVPFSRTIPSTKTKDSPSPYLLISYCLMPNHFHLLLKQHKPSPTISDFMRRISITYAMYFQKKYQHSGTLFQGKYKNILISSEIQLNHLSKYIHRNPLPLPKNQPLSAYQYSSYPTYLGLTKTPWIHPHIILNQFSTTNPSLSYKSFVEETSDIPKEIQALTLD